MRPSRAALVAAVVTLVYVAHHVGLTAQLLIEQRRDVADSSAS